MWSLFVYIVAHFPPCVENDGWIMMHIFFNNYYINFPQQLHKLLFGYNGPKIIIKVFYGPN